MEHSKHYIVLIVSSFVIVILIYVRRYVLNKYHILVLIRGYNFLMFDYVLVIELINIVRYKKGMDGRC